MEITRELAQKVLSVVDAGLASGLGKPVPGQMCVEAAVNYALGGEHNDIPACVGSAVRAFKIRLNDAPWPSKEARTKGMRKLAIAQLGSEIDQNEFRQIVVVGTVRRILPIALRASGSLIPAHKDALEGAAVACAAVRDGEAARVVTSEALEVSSRMATRAARSSALAAHAAAEAAALAAEAAYNDADAAFSDEAAALAAEAADSAFAAHAAAEAAALAADLVADEAAYATASSAAHNAAEAAEAAADAAAYVDADAADAARLKVLTIAAEIGLEALIQLKSPGCQWLDLCDDV